MASEVFPTPSEGFVLEPPTDPTRASAFLNLRVADIQTTYEEWRSRGAEFLTPPKVRRYASMLTVAMMSSFSRARGSEMIR
jgi:hypothetical protein